jgi:hypothetical protein
MTITQTVKIPADRRIMLDVPPQIPAGATARFEIIWFPANNEVAPLTKANVSLPRDNDGKILLTKAVIEEMEKNSPTLHKLTGILHTDMTIDEIRMARLAKHL